MITETINYVMWHALHRAGVLSTREPADRFRTDSRRPDEATLVPWSGGLGDYNCSSYISSPVASVQAANSKLTKNMAGYLPHTSSSHWPSRPRDHSTPQPLILLMRSSIVSQPSVEGDRCQTTLLFQHLSITIQEYNLVTFLTPSPQPDQANNTKKIIITIIG